MKFSSATILASFFILFAACGGGGGGDSGGAGGGACGSLNAKVFNGETCDQSSRSPVVALLAYSGSGDQTVIRGICTGTLVTLDDVLTSAHCFLDPGAEGWVAAVGGNQGEFLDVVRASLHPFYDGSVGTPYDIAMVTLSAVPSPPIGPVPVLISQLTQVGETVSVYGYGTNNRGELGILKSATLKIDGFSGGNIISTLETSGASICQGDSGGPVIQVVRGVPSIVGVNSFGVGPANGPECGASGAYLSGMVDLQNPELLSFISGYAADVAVN